MEHWTFWEWIAYAILFVGALILAADQGLKIAPDLMKTMPDFVSGPIWGLAPLVAVLLATGVLLAHGLGWIGRAPDGGLKERPTFAQWPNPYMPIAVIGKTFRNERVLLDGHSFTDCKFYNVTFVYNGTTAIQLTHNEFHGVYIASDNPAVSGAAILLRGLGFLKEGIPVDMPPGNTIVPPQSVTDQPSPPATSHPQ